MNNSDLWVKIITLVIAGYGAILSTVTLIQRHKEKTPKIIVKLKTGFFTYNNPFNPISSTCFFIEAMNSGEKPITVNGVGFILPNNDFMQLIRWEGNIILPHELNSGKNMSIGINMEEIKQLLLENGFKNKVSLIAYIRTATDDYYKSKPKIYDLSQANH